ncbi:MAG: DMT family transporter [Bacteroidota bacterium]|nr:DMT family transporter [Bacteroidota bacterium]
MKKETYRGHVAMLVANFAWGFLSPLSKAVLLNSDVSPLALTTFRITGGAITFWIASLFVKRESVERRDMLMLALASIFAIVFNQVSFIKGVSLTSPIDASIITTTLPIITMIVSAFYLKEAITWKKIVGITFGASGALLLIVSGHHSGSRSSSVWGDLLCLLAQFSFTIYLVWFKGLIGKYSPVTLMKWMFTFASLFCLPLSFNQLTTINYSLLPTPVYFDIAFIVLAGTFLGYLLIPIGQRNLRPTEVSMYNYLQPVVASVLSLIWGMDTFGVMKGIAVALVFSGVYIVTQNISFQFSFPSFKKIKEGYRI